MLAKAAAYVFPAYAGMSRTDDARTELARRFPRLRGDEPWVAELRRTPVAFSPPTRG